MSYEPGRCASCHGKFLRLIKTVKYWKDIGPEEQLLCKGCFMNDQ